MTPKVTGLGEERCPHGHPARQALAPPPPPREPEWRAVGGRNGPAAPAPPPWRPLWLLPLDVGLCPWCLSEAGIQPPGPCATPGPSAERDAGLR